MKNLVSNVFVYKKNVILIITKHVLYKECFPDELNYLFYFNVSDELFWPSDIFCFVRTNAQGQSINNIC